MISADKSALMCDLAETYHIYNYRSLPATLVATFAVGLRDDSRIKMKMSGAKVPQDTLILSIVADRVGQLLWMFSEDGSKGVNRPPSLLEALFEEEFKEAGSDVLSFSSPEEFEQARRELLEKGGHNG